MADGRSKRMGDLAIGDWVYGTVREGSYRRFTATQVKDKWSSIKPAYSVDVADGNRLIASGDHRFLTRRGWKHVLGTEWGPLQRPHLTVGSRLLGPGGCVAAPIVDDDYRRGYICGMVRGDGHVGAYAYDRPGRSHANVYHFRLALADTEALERTDVYLTSLGVVTRRFVVSQATANHREMGAIRSQARGDVEQIQQLIRWPILPSLSWMKGFLAGIFDAEGSCSGEALRIHNTDPEIVGWAKAALGRLGFSHATDTCRSSGVMSVRVKGGLAERMRFFLGTDPAITRKREIAGAALKTAAELDVEAIRPLGMTMRLYDITTGTGDFIANGVVSHNCFARPTHKYLDFDAGRDFEREIVVKVNAPEVLRAELARPSWKGEHVALGTNTDPYQWVEGRYKLMEGIWEAMRDAANPVLGAHEVAAAAARSGTDAADRTSGRASARACRSRRSTRRHGARPSRTRRTRGRVWRRSPSSTARASRRAC